MAVRRGIGRPRMCDHAVGMSGKLGIAVIGMGWMGEAHSRAYLQARHRFADRGLEPRLVVCADEVEARRQAAQRAYGFARTTADWREAVAAPDVDIVDVTAPNFLHRTMAEAAIAAGKHVFCEKPVGRSAQETLAVAAAAERAGIVSGVGYNYACAPMVQHARRLVEAGRLGELTHYRGRFFSGYGRDPNGVLSWRFRREQAGSGTLADLISHVVDTAHFIAGPIRRVVSQRHTFIAERPLATPGEGTHFSARAGGPTGPVSNEDYVGMLVEFAGGARGTLEACRVIFGPECQMAFEVNGRRGALAWDFERLNELQVRLAGDDGTPGDGFTTAIAGPQHPDHGRFNPGAGIGIGYDDTLTIELAEFLSAVAAGTPGRGSLAAAAAVAHVQQAVARSWDSGSWETVAS